MNSVISSKSAPAKTSLGPTFGHLSRVVGHSAAVRRLEDAIARVGQLDCPVLLTGETGSGKDEAARAIHAAGSRAARPFVPINCAGIVGTLAESLLFGHEQGSFTGADTATSGAFRAAHGGILFLDEIGELPPDLQPKLLRVLELREVVPVGATKPVKVDVQVIAAECAERFDRPGWTLPDEAIRRFMEHSWPGNVRELRRDAVRRALAAIAYAAQQTNHVVVEVA